MVMWPACTRHCDGARREGMCRFVKMLPVCPICKFRSSTAKRGRCRKNGRVFFCRRKLPLKGKGRGKHEGNDGNEGNEGNGGNEGNDHEGNEGNLIE